MKTRTLFVVILLPSIFILAACGPSPDQVNATATQIAANIFATQTAQAPTATMTFTPSPTATSTPTLTPTPTSTSTPLPTATPTPGLASVAITLDDLPFGFDNMPASQLEDMKKQLPEDAAGFGFLDDQNFQIIVGLIFPLKVDPGVAAVDVMLPTFVNMYATMFGADKNVKNLAGIEDLGQARAGTTSTGPMYGFTLRWEFIAFYQNQAVVILVDGFQDTYTPDITAVDLSKLLDERIMHFRNPLLNPGPSNADSIAGTWKGTIIAADETIVSDVNLEISAGCTVSNKCGTVSAVDLPCSGEIVLQSTVGNTFVFAEQNITGSASCLRGGHEYIRLLSNGKLFWRFEYIDPAGKVTISKAVLEKQ